MGLFDRFIKRSEKATEDIVNENTVNDSLLRALLNSEVITKEKALSLPVVASAVDKISGIVAMLPIYLYEETITEDGKRQIKKIENDNRVNLLNDDTGDTLDSFQFKKALIQDYLLDKGGFAYINKRGKEFVSLHYVEASQVSYIKNVDPIFKDGQYLVYGKKYELYKFIALLRETKDGITGKGLIEEVSRAIETAFTNMLFELNLVKKGGVKKGFIGSEKKLDKDAMKELKKAWKQLYSTGEENMMILNNGLKFQDAGATGVELQLNERKKGLNEEINNIFHISNDNNVTIKEAIMPIVKALETALNRNFLLETEKENYYFATDIREIIKGSIKDRYEAYKLAIDSGWQTKNEVRYLEDLEQLDGLDIITFNLANVIYDTKTKQYYVPNTGAVFDTLGEAVKESKGGGSNEGTN